MSPNGSAPPWRRLHQSGVSPNCSTPPWRSPLPWLGGLLALYLLGPLVALLPRLGQAGSGAPGLGSALAVSALTATISSLLIALGGIPLAYQLAQSRGRLGHLLGVAVQLPLALPPLVSGILLIELVGPYSFLGRLLGGRLTDSLAGIVVAQTFVAAPFLIVAARSAFSAINPDLVEVAATLGHRPWSRFARVSLPLAAPGIRAGLLLSWLRAFGEFGATVVLAYHPYSLPVYTYVQFTGTGLAATVAPTAAALGTALAVLALAHWRPKGWLGAITRRHWPLSTLSTERRGTEGRGGEERGTEGRGTPGGPLTFDLDTRLGSFHLRLAHAGQGRHLALLGPSGAGKSLTLRALAGLLGPSAGAVRLGGTGLGHLGPEDRNVGWVPQDAGLLPHLRVWEQVTFGVSADPRVAAWWLGRLGLAGLQDRLPSQLSGGQRQRVALARALARGAQLILLDEPFSSLDAPVRDDLRHQLRQLQRETEVTTVVVTHDPQEAALLADEVLVVSEGRLLQAGATSAVLRRPASAQVARLVGMANLRPGRIVAPGRMEAERTVLAVADLSLATGTEVRWGVRREQVEVEPLPVAVPVPAGQAQVQEMAAPALAGQVPEATVLDAPALSQQLHEATVLDVIDLGAWTEVSVRLDGGLELTGRAVRDGWLDCGQRCRLGIAAEAITLWPEAGAPMGSAMGGPDRPAPRLGD